MTVWAVASLLVPFTAAVPTSPSARLLLLLLLYVYARLCGLALNGGGGGGSRTDSLLGKGRKTMVLRVCVCV